MRWSLLLMLVVFLSLATGRSSAQYDPNCYFPKVGEPGVIDTIYGSEANQRLSSSINIGPAPGESYGRVLFSGLPQNPPFINAVSTGPGFDLHKLQTLGPKAFNLNYYINPNYVRFGHFHSPRYRDILYGRSKIYWSDENGDYDSTRTTSLNVATWDSGLDEYWLQPSYTTYLSQDSVEDIVFGVDRFIDNHPFNLNLDSSYLVLFKGGSSLYRQGQFASPDSEVDLGAYDSAHVYLERPGLTEGDWRGTGREDLLAGDYHGNLYFYRNDPPFSFSNLAHALLYDTLYAISENPQGAKNTSWLSARSATLQALTKIKRGGAQDLVLNISSNGPTGDSRYDSYQIFRGGADFASHRWTMDSASFYFYTPDHYDPTLGNVFGNGFTNCGDMTGTGNNVLFFQGLYLQNGEALDALNCFYVLGDAMDDKIDMEFECSTSSTILNTSMQATGVDTLTADGDGLEDVIIGLQYYVSEKDLDTGSSNVGSVQVIHGSKNIPVHGNGVARKTSETANVDIYPNPLHSVGTVQFQSDGIATEATIIMRDLLGREVFEANRSIGSGQQSLKINFGNLSSGSYRLEVAFGAQRLTKQVVVVK